MATPRNVALALRRMLDMEALPPVVPTRRAGPAWLMNPRRFEIVLAAAAYPGIHLRSASKLLLSPLPSLRFHVGRLVARGLLRTHPFSWAVCLFVPGLYRPSSEPLLVAWSNPLDRRVLHDLHVQDPAMRSSLIAALGVDDSRLDRSLRRLRALGAIRTRTSKAGRTISVTARWSAFERECFEGGEARLGRFVTLLDAEGLHPEVEVLEAERARIRADGPTGRLRFLLPLNPLTRDPAP